MSLALQKYTEPLNDEELMFLRRKEERERKQYYKVYRLLMVMSFIIPFAGAWYRAADGAPNAFSREKFFLAAGVLLFISTFATYMAYLFNLRRVQRDIKYKTKTIEIDHITNKKYMPHNNCYYFYIDSTVRLSIEVTQLDFHRLDVGDEVAIEYTTHSKEYLGYF
jgi:hypothetical protein